MRKRDFTLNSKLEQSFCAVLVGFLLHNVLLCFFFNRNNCQPNELLVMYPENVRKGEL